MTYNGSSYYTAHAYARAHNIGVNLTPELGESWVARAKTGDIFWEGPPEHNGAIPVHVNHMNKRLRLIMDADKGRIITLAERDFASKNAVKQAERFGIVLNQAMASLLIDKIKANDDDVLEIEEGIGRTSEAKLTFDGRGLRVVYSIDSGCIIQLDDYAGPRVDPKHPAVTRHAAERAVQRYEVELTPAVTEEIVRKITTGKELIDHYKIKSGAMAAIVEIAPDKPACIIYARTPNEAVPIRIITVTPMDFHEAHGERFVAIREAQHAKVREERRERYQDRKKAQKKQNARYHKAQRAENDDEDEFGYGT